MGREKSEREEKEEEERSGRKGGPGSPAEPRTRWGLASTYLLASIFTRSKRFFRFLLRGPLFMVPDSIQPRSMPSCILIGL